MNRIDLSPDDEIVFSCLIQGTRFVFLPDDAGCRKILDEFLKSNIGKTGLFKIQLMADKKIFGSD